MLKIKLARFGRKGQPMYRIVVNEARDKRDGKYVAKVGHYFPQQQPKVLKIDLKAVEQWMVKGAQPTDTVASLIARYKSGKPFPPKKKKLSKKAKAKLKAAETEKEAEEIKKTPVEAVKTVKAETVDEAKVDKTAKAKTADKAEVNKTAKAK